ncbi:MAG TPA: hypothetical protein VK204_04235 [Nocardioidaceae bacterium]|jgi:PBP1b-binding outer membrane lipoprotein LpoB|nr:hypothetical protein [Nocardioidaceae bacterium]
MKRTILATMLASALVLSGCGNKEDEQAKASISDYFTQQQAGQQGASMKKKEADCLASGMVDDIGVEQLKKYKILKEDGSFNKEAQGFTMSKDDSEVMADAFLKCTDTIKTMKAQIASDPSAQTPEAKKCFAETLTEDKVRSMLVANFSGDQKKATEFQSELMKCAAAGQPAPSQAPSPAPSPAPKK